VCRELTKLHEEMIHSTSQDILTKLPKERGEFTIVLGPQPVKTTAQAGLGDEEIASLFYQLTKSMGLSRRAAITETAKNIGLSTKTVYAAIERAKNAAPP
jgi:16S rRNA C1402 (ribose-2'-O) methylase RsmI